MRPAWTVRRSLLTRRRKPPCDARADTAFFTGQLDAASPFGTLRRLMERGIEIAGGDDHPRATRLREALDFYAFVEHAIPEAVARYRHERGLRKETERR